METKSIYNELKKYSVRFINENYLIKVYGVDENGCRINKLVGVRGALTLIGGELLEKFVSRAERDRQDVCVCKLRRGIIISLYTH